MRVLGLLAAAQDLLAKIEGERRLLEPSLKAGGRTAARAKTSAASLDKIRARLATDKGRYPQPRLIDQIGYLSSMLDQADQRPGRDAYLRFEELRGELESCQALLDQSR